VYYEFDITVPAGTTETNATETIQKIQRGVITYAEVQFPDGCVGLVKLRGFLNATQIWPRNKEGYVHGNNDVVPINEYLEVGRGKNTLRFKTWNDDDTYSHTLTVRITVSDPDIFNPTRVFERLAVDLEKLLRRIRALDS